MVLVPSGDAHGTAVICLYCLYSHPAIFNPSLDHIYVLSHALFKSQLSSNHLFPTNLATAWTAAGQGRAGETGPMESSDKAVVLGSGDLIFPLPHHITGADLEVTLPAWLFTLPPCSSNSVLWDSHNGPGWSRE